MDGRRRVTLLAPLFLNQEENPLPVILGAQRRGSHELKLRVKTPEILGL